MRKRLLTALVPGFVPAIVGLLITAPLSLLCGQGSPGGVRFMGGGQPPVVIHSTVEDMARAHGARPGRGHSSNLSYHGGALPAAPQNFFLLGGRRWDRKRPNGRSPPLQYSYKQNGGPRSFKYRYHQPPSPL